MFNLCLDNWSEAFGMSLLTWDPQGLGFIDTSLAIIYSRHSELKFQRDS
jgi:hypothetical protein